MRRRRRENMTVNGEINVVSLIDVMMLLMVIFMITAPMMQSGLDVSLPKADAPALESRNAIIVQVRKNGEISVDGAVLSTAEFERNFKALADRKGKDGVYLQGDEAVQYGEIVKLYVMMVNSGVTNIMMVTEPPETSSR